MWILWPFTPPTWNVVGNVASPKYIYLKLSTIGASDRQKKMEDLHLKKKSEQEDINITYRFGDMRDTRAVNDDDVYITRQATFT